MHRMLQGAFCLEGYYEVYLGNHAAGKVQILRQGLYCRVICRCRIDSDQVYRLYAVSEDSRENLGVVVPEGDGFLLDRKIPVKRLGNGKLRFVLSCGVGGLPGKFVPISPEEPFFYIDRLKTAFLQSERGKVGIRIEENPEAV